MASTARLGVLLVSALAFSTIALAEGASPSPPLANWSAPATYTPSRGGKIRTLSDISNPVPFIGIAPCRQYNSLLATPLLQGVNRAVPLTGAPCNIPASAVAVSANITIFNITGATGNGVFKVDTVTPPAVAWINYPPTEAQRGNAGVVALNGSGQIIVQVAQGAGQVDFVVDVNAYAAFSTPANPLNPNENFSIVGNFSGGAMIQGENLESAGANSRGGLFITHSTGSGSAGVFGSAVGTAGNAAGVQGTTSSSAGAGVRGIGSLANGVIGNTNTTGLAGVKGNVNDPVSGNPVAIGYLGASNNLTLIGNRGVFGFTLETANDTAGIEGGTADVVTSGTGFLTSGVRGESEAGIGVLGISTANGVYGALKNGNAGILGASNRTADGSTQDWGVLALGDIGATGVKKFVEPDASDPNRQIEYVALEGPEPGTYFRGTSRTYRGRAVIQVPEDFYTVTDENALTVQLTPVGELATMAVLSEDLSRIVVASSKDVTFHYLVQGVRRSFKDYRPIREAGVYVPASPRARMQVSLPEEIQRRLIANGTYNGDGTVNMTTAGRVGWTKIWAEREAQTQAAAKEKEAQSAAAAGQH